MPQCVFGCPGGLCRILRARRAIALAMQCDNAIQRVTSELSINLMDVIVHKKAIVWVES